MNYTLAIVHLGDVLMGADPVAHKFPGGGTRADAQQLKEIQRRLTALGFDTGGTDGRIGNDTMKAVQNFQRKLGMQRADGYAGMGLLARLRKGS